MTPLPKHFSTYSPCPSNKKISTADGTLITVAGQGDVQITPTIILKNVLHVPKLSTNLISIQKLTKDLLCNVIFHSNSCILQDKKSGRTIGHAREWNGLYYMENLNLPIESHSLISESTITSKEKVQLIHCRLGHPSFRVIKLLFPSLFKNLNLESFHCEACELAKHKRVPFPISNKLSTSPFYLVHTDVWGPSNIPNISGAKWFITFIDDCTRVMWLFLLKHKSEVSSVFLRFVSMIKNQFGVNIKKLRSNNAKDYFNHTLNFFCQKEGIIHESSCVHTPQQNGIAERKNGHLLDQTRALIFQNNVPKIFWGEAVLTATYLINRLPSTILSSKSPMEVLKSFYPHITHTNNHQPRIFGCVSFVHVHSSGRGKLDPRAIKCVFLGYSATQKGYKCFHPPSQKFFVSRDVTFHEQISYFSQPHLQGENLREEDEPLILPNLSFGPEIRKNTVGPEIQKNTTTIYEAEAEEEQVEVNQIPAPAGSAADTETTTRPHDDTKFGKNLVYTRRGKAIPRSSHVQESNPISLHEVNHFDPINSNSTNCDEFPYEKLAAQVDHNLDLPIALRKGTRTCTKHQLLIKPLSQA
uniref:Retrovirus-related Pol polyprotein from transposon TNT 1-94 n=1 Tax=Cajanus cajan TaxID=3821 RepID=A0A151SJL3_CAJCA|nr:Retrovirus-related Pol polyprotein from transposon TNT 1-94 [Cajanus cajan]